MCLWVNPNPFQPEPILTCDPPRPYASLLITVKCGFSFLNHFLFLFGFCMQNSLLKFVRLVKAKEQVVAGMLYHMTLEANDAGKTKVYETKVWVKPWMNFKEMTEFKVSDVDHSV